jgi:hypothetical protein
MRKIARKVIHVQQQKFRAKSDLRTGFFKILKASRRNASDVMGAFVIQQESF